MAADREVDRLQRENEELRRQLAEANDALRATRNGEVDALVVRGRAGHRLDTLESAYEPYRVFVEQMEQGAASLTADGLILYSNRRFAEILGVPGERLPGVSIYTVIDEPHHGPLRLLLAATPDRPQDREMNIAARDGRQVHALFSVRAMPDGTRCAVLTDVTDRVRQRELLASKEWLQTTLASIGDCVVSCDAAGRITFLNAVAERVTGWTEAEALGQPIQTVFRIVNEITHEPIEDPVARVLGDGQVVLLGNHTALITRDGREVPVEDSAAPIRDPAGNLAGVVLVFQDVTTRRQAHRALRESEAKFRALFEYSPDAVLLTAADGQIVAANPAACAMFQMSEEEIRARGRDGLGEPGDPIWRAMVEERRRTGILEDWEATYVRRSGERFQGETNSVLLPGGSQAFVVVRDVTERKRAEAALAESEERFRITQDLSPDGFTILRPIRDAGGHVVDFTFVYENEAIAALNGTDRTAVVGKRLLDVFPSHGRSPLHKAYQEVAESMEPRVVEAPYQGDSIPNPTWFRAVIVPIRGDIAILAQDVTERKRIEDALRAANAQLAEADRRKDEFIAVLSHELRNPLAPIRYALPVLQAQKVDAAGSRAIAVIDRQVDHLTRLVDDLLDVSRITRGKIDLRKEYITIASAVTAAAEAASPAMVAARHRLNIAVPEEPIWLHADGARISQVITNLLTNSAKYTPRGGDIILAVERDSDQAVIRVRDNGVGIPPEALGTIFEMFTQVGAPDRSQGGLGIGLALVRQLVEMHGGTIDAHSAGKGQGAEFVVRLPLVSQGQAAESAHAAPARTEGGRLRVLIVDDNADLVEMLAIAVESAGHEVRKALDGPSAISAALSYRPHVVFLDLGLPVMSGLEVAKELRRHPETANARLVALTGRGQPEDRRLTQEAGFEHHLTKPTEPQLLQRLLADLATRREL